MDAVEYLKTFHRLCKSQDSGWMIRYYTDLPKLPKESVNDFWAGYDNSSKKSLIENKIINKGT